MSDNNEYTKDKLTLIVDELYKLKLQREEIDKQIKELESPFKKLLTDGETIYGNKVLVTLNKTDRQVCDPYRLKSSVPEDVFMKCITVNMAEAKKTIDNNTFNELCTKVPYQTRLDFKARVD